VTPITVDALPAILLAEDDPVTRMLMTRFLKNAGYEVDAVANGSEALDKMTKRYYPILVTDWEMPEMDGIALCNAVRNMQLDGYVYALLLTARDAKEHIIAGLEAGADDYLVKPVHEAELIARLNAGRRILALEHSLRVANQRNRILSITDALTGAYNRRLLDGAAAARVRALPPLRLPLVGADVRSRSFQTGQRPARPRRGDDVLQQFACRAQKYIRTNSDWIARYGGEEISDRAAGNRTRRWRAGRRKNPQSGGRLAVATRAGDTQVTASFGIASTGPNGPDLTLKAETLIRAADESLYKSKLAGRNCSSGQELAAPLPLVAHG